MIVTKRLAYATALLAVSLSSVAFAYSGENLTHYAKLTIERATAVALKARPGTITDRELEREGGGSGLRYSFDIKSHAVVYEVGVDAKTGKVFENSTEGAHPD